VPAHTGPVTLFIDPFGRPLSPISVCGVRCAQARPATGAATDVKPSIRLSVTDSAATAGR
jgi:hypothetical protein